MKRSSKRHKVMDVSAAEDSASQNQPLATNKLEKDKDLSQRFLLDEGDSLQVFDNEEFDEWDITVEDSFNEDFVDDYDQDFTDEINRFDESDEAFIDELIQSFPYPLEVGLEPDIDAEIDVRHTLEQAMIGALDAADTKAFFGHVLNAIDHITPSLSQGRVQVETRHKRKTKAEAQKLEVQHNGHQHRQRKIERNGRRTIQPNPPRNGHSRQAPIEFSHQPLAHILRELRSMLRRYSLRGLDELDALEDTADLFAEVSMNEAVPILVGLTARVAIRPKLDQTGKKFSPTLRKRMISFTDQAVNTLVRGEGVQALPGLAHSLGQLSIRQGLSVKALPKLIRSTATRTVASPKLMRHLSSINLGAVTLTSVKRSEMPLHVRVSGPLEIIIRDPQGA